jgi:hypothetical protein
MEPPTSAWAEIRQEVARVTAGREWSPTVRTMLDAAAVLTRIDYPSDWAERFEQAFRQALSTAEHTGQEAGSQGYEDALVRELRRGLGLGGK